MEGEERPGPGSGVDPPPGPEPAVVPGEGPVQVELDLEDPGSPRSHPVGVDDARRLDHHAQAGRHLVEAPYRFADPAGQDYGDPVVPGRYATSRTRNPSPAKSLRTAGAPPFDAYSVSAMILQRA
jgi:hypothetical protein